MDRHDLQDAQIELMREILSKGGHFTFRAFGHSMFPMILPGTEVTVRPLRTTPPPVGTVLVAEREGTLVCHRLVKVRREGRGSEARWIYHMRGDNHSTEDPPFDEAKVLGEVESLRFGTIGISADFAPYRLTGNMWALFPRPARLAVGILRWMLDPGRRLLETAHGSAARIFLPDPRIRVVDEEGLGEFQSRALHLGIAWSRERSVTLAEDLCEGRAVLLEADRDGATAGALLAVTGEIAGSAWLEFLRLAHPRRGTGLDYLLVEEAVRHLRDRGFRILRVRSGAPLSDRRLRRLGFRPDEGLGARGWAWSKRI